VARFARIRLLYLFLLFAAGFGSLPLHVSAEGKIYEYDVFGDPSRLLKVSRNFSFDFDANGVFEKYLMLSGWYAGASDGRWAGREEFADLRLPLFGKGRHRIECLCLSVRSATQPSQLMKVLDGQDVVWEGPVKCKSWTKKLYHYLAVNAEHDFFKDLRARVTPTAGLGYWLSDTSESVA